MNSGRPDAGKPTEGEAPETLQEQMRRSTAGSSPDRPPTPPPPRPFGLRIAFYILVIYLCYIAGTTLVIYLLEGPEMIRSLWNAEGEPPVIPLLLGFKAQLFLAPIIFAVTGLFAAAERRTWSDLGVAWPKTRIASPPVQALAAVAVAAGSLGAYWLLAEQFATFTSTSEFPADQVTAMGNWLPLHATGLVLFAVAFFVLGMTEEVIFRGYVYAVLRDRLPWIHAAGLSGILFALFNPGDPVVLAPSLLNIFLVGLLLAALREGSGSLLVGGLFHGTWNLILGCVLALPVSGLQVPRMKQVAVEGPLWVTGGDFGPEGSWLLTGFLLAAVLAATAWIEAGAEDGPAAAESESAPG